MTLRHSYAKISWLDTLHHEYAKTSDRLWYLKRFEITFLSGLQDQPLQPAGRKEQLMRHTWCRPVRIQGPRLFIIFPSLNRGTRHYRPRATISVIAAEAVQTVLRPTEIDGGTHWLWIYRCCRHR